MMRNLYTISKGEPVVISKIEDSSLRVKLMEMGLVEGRELEVLYHAPFGGPVAINVGSYVISLRKDEAQLISVIKVEL